MVLADIVLYVLAILIFFWFKVHQTTKNIQSLSGDRAIYGIS